MNDDRFDTYARDQLALIQSELSGVKGKHSVLEARVSVIEVNIKDLRETLREDVRELRSSFRNWALGIVGTMVTLFGIAVGIMAALR